MKYIEKWRLENQDKIRKNNSNYYSRNKERLRMEKRVRRLIAQGRLDKANCEVCFNPDVVQLHTDENENPLEVRWMCKVCRDDFYKDVNSEIKKIEQRIKDNEFYRRFGRDW